MKKKLLFIFALLCAVAQGAWSQKVVDLSELSIYNNNTYVAKYGDVLTGSLPKYRSVSIANGATVTLRNVRILTDFVTTDWKPCLECLGDATIILEEGSTNVIWSYLQPGIKVAQNTTTTIKGSGELKIGVYGSCWYPGIGGDNCGNIVIEGGTITTSGGMVKKIIKELYDWAIDIGAPGIGAAVGGSCGNITISGGTIYATGQTRAAGIGKSYKSSCGTITISGNADVHAYGGESGAGIGGGMMADGCTVRIEGGKVYACGGEGGAGIGGGDDADFKTGGSGGDILISGGDVEAHGGDYAAGIGAGDCGKSGGTITINGGTVKAYGGKDAAGIGGGESSDGDQDNSGNIVINGGDVYACGKGWGVGIGAGEDGDVEYIRINGGTIVAEGGDDIHRAVGGEDDEDFYDNHLSLGSGIMAYITYPAPTGDVVLQWALRQSQMKDYGILKFKPCDHAVPDLQYHKVDDYKHQFFCSWCGAWYEEDHTGEYTCNKCDYSRSAYIIHYYELVYDEQSQQYKYQEVASESVKDSFVLPGQTVSAPEDRCFEGWVNAGGIPDANDDGLLKDNENLYSPDQDLVASGDVHFKARYRLLYIIHYYEIVYDEQNQQYKYQEVASESVRDSFVLPELSGSLPFKRSFLGWVNAGGIPDANDDGLVEDSENPYSPGQNLTASGDMYLKARYCSSLIDLANIQSNLRLIDGMVLNGTLDVANYPVKITIADGATVTLSDVTINGVNNNSYSWAGITCEGDATIILADGTKNTVKGFYETYPGLYVPANYTLTIKGDGSLNASSNGKGAGIGSGYKTSSAGTICIQSGNITAEGGEHSAGIGCSYNNSCDNILISGGTINATGGSKAAAIGSGYGGKYSHEFSNCGVITISCDVTSLIATKGSDAPNSIGAGKGGTCTSVVIGSKAGAVERSPYYYFPLENASSNTAKITAFNGNVCDVTLKDRTLYQNNSWNTLCLPFSMTAEQISSSPLAKGRIVELDTEKTTLSDGVLTIAYKTATEIEAGKPYMVKWVIDEEAEDTRIDNPIFKDITLSASAPTAIKAASIGFYGTFAPLTLADGDKTRLWLDDDVRLRWASGQDEQVSSTWCYWDLDNRDASTLNAIVVTFDEGSFPIVELMDGMTDFSILSKFGEQEVNASLEGRELSAVQQADGTWQSRAYTLCLPFYAELFGTGCDFTIYSKAEVTENNELLFTEEMLPFLYPGNAYLIVVNEGTLRLQEEGVTLVAEADEADEWENAVPFNYVDEQTAGYWLGSLKTIGHDEAVSRKAFTLASDGSFQRITDENPTWKWPAFRATFCATDLMTADKLTTKYQLDANGEEEEDRSLPAPESYQGDNDGEATAIAPVIHTINLDGTERWFDLSGRQLSGKPAKKGVYIHRGKKQVVK